MRKRTAIVAPSPPPGGGRSDDAKRRPGEGEAPSSELAKTPLPPLRGDLPPPGGGGRRDRRGQSLSRQAIAPIEFDPTRRPAKAAPTSGRSA
jgi:hypothetical protein